MFDESKQTAYKYMNYPVLGDGSKYTRMIVHHDYCLLTCREFHNASTPIVKLGMLVCAVSDERPFCYFGDDCCDDLRPISYAVEMSVEGSRLHVIYVIDEILIIECPSF